ncbi:hypothetical protein PF006_g12229 [Phytophthora fragariae]|uniref:RxLR effector protein n=1 Tax=Phytophthora fragariae TaxID=53985 RepID=A0A6A3U6G2_9STRA|nr:hypothetical protein PF006_g12229 [Phytophthora fragariae]
MKFYAFLAAALIAAAQAKNVLQSQDASQASQAKDIVQKKGLSTPKSTVKYLDISEGLATKYPMPTGNVTIKPTRPDPRETEPPTPASTLPPTPAAAFKLQATPPADAEVLATARKSTDARAGTTTRGLSCTPVNFTNSETPHTNPDVPEPKILGISASAHSGYKKYSTPPENLDGNSVKVNYEDGWPINHALDTTDKAGTFQDLIMWEQMTEDARRALNSVSFGKANTPMNDGNFRSKLDKAWPF